MDLEAIDRFVTAYLNDLSGHIPTLDGIMVIVTGYGAFAIVAAVAIRWWWNGSADKLRERHLAILCGLSVVIGLAMNQGVLLFVHRMRPYDAGVTHLLIAPSADPSFPSDHATLAFAIVFALLGAGARRGWGFLVAAVVLACSRVYVGTHYASDILGGALTGLAAASSSSRCSSAASDPCRGLRRSRPARQGMRRDRDRPGSVPRRRAEVSAARPGFNLLSRVLNEKVAAWHPGLIRQV